MMWALIVAGHIVGTYAGLGTCQNQAAIMMGITGKLAECVQIPTATSPQEDMLRRLETCMALYGPAMCGMQRP
jgi:hypothetical protein